MARNWLGPQLYGPNDVLTVCLVVIVLIFGAPVIALILRGFRVDYRKLEADEWESLDFHIERITDSISSEAVEEES